MNYPVHALAQKARELPPRERDKFLTRVCGGNAELRAEVDALVAALEAPTPCPPTQDKAQNSGDALTGRVPSQLGRYRILSVLGQGGMGVVYQAEQDHPQRIVALKVVRPEALSAELLRRFECESLVLARLQHPGIAQIFEAGTVTDDQGRVLPFFAMEFVRGKPLNEHAQGLGLDVGARLDLLARVCDAVEHAHQKGVIHRDLKPGNILVDGSGQPRILDFGIARVTEADGAQTTMHTEVGRLLGTLEYMSPEQITGRVDDLDTRSDVYALGVIGYELLTGRLPYELDRTKFHEVLRTIREIEPTRISRYAPALRGDVETILVKALEKDRQRRYASAGALADDLRRHLRHEPITARPATTWYQIVKFARRNRGLVAGLVLAFIVLVLGLVGTTLGLRRAKSSEHEAQSHLQRYELLAGMVTLPVLEQEVEELWPETPAMVPAMEDWLARAQQLVEQRERVAAALEAVSARQRPMTAEERERARQRHPRFRALAEAETELSVRQQELAELKAAPEPGSYGQHRIERLLGHEIPILEARIAKLTDQIAATQSAMFPAPADQFLYDTLNRLAEGLERVEKERTPAVSSRLGWAKQVRERTLVDEAAAWDRAIAAIADPQACPLYQGLRIRPQIGLVPLGPNPGSGLWEFWCPRTGARPERSADGRLNFVDETGIVLVLIPGGSFTMGSQSADSEGSNHDPSSLVAEQPVTKVTLEPFFLARHELTIGQWQQWTHHNPCADKPYSPRNGAVTLRHPVSQVSWLDCERVLRQMALALPTEAQWEYACRAGKTSIWATGNDPVALAGIANLADEGSRGSFGPQWAFDPGVDDGFDADAPVGSLAANAWGLHDMHGNVLEWCLDEYCSYEIAPRSGNGERSGDGDSERVIRGGAFTVRATYARSAYRLRNKPNHLTRNLGVRAARPVVR